MSIKIQLRRIDNRLDVLATADDAGEAHAETAMPPDALINQLKDHNPANYPDALMETIGEQLFATLISGEVEALMRVVLHDAKQAREPLRVELRFDDQQVDLARYPWEMIAEEGQFFVRDGEVDMTRYITYPSAPPDFETTDDLSLLRVVASPKGLPPIFADELGIERLETLDNASFDALTRKLLLEGPPMWSLQFDGHGGLVCQCENCDTVNQLTEATCTNCGTDLAGLRQIASLAFERGGLADWVTTDDFGGILSNADIRLVMLLACDSATIGDGLLYSGLAPRLTLAGVPAVIGMQYKVTDAFANDFARDFYAALLREGDIVRALRTARRLHSRTAWYSPVLYMRHQRDFTKEETDNPVYLPRRIDTAVPTQVRPDTFFLVKLWIRRPETAPASEDQLRSELNIPADVPVGTASGEANIKFDPVEERSLRRGKVEVRLESPVFEVTPQVRDLFIDETLDAPPAIFVLRGSQVGTFPLIFSLWQDGGQIHTAVHQIEVQATEVPVAAVRMHSTEIEVGGDGDSLKPEEKPADWEAETVERPSPAAKPEEDAPTRSAPRERESAGRTLMQSLTRLVPVLVMIAFAGVFLIFNGDFIGQVPNDDVTTPLPTSSNSSDDGGENGSDDGGSSDGGGRTDTGSDDSGALPSPTPRPTSQPPTQSPATWTPAPSPTADVNGPPAPALVSPENGFRFVNVSEVTLEWRAVEDPSGIGTYIIEVQYRPNSGYDWGEYDTYVTQETTLTITDMEFGSYRWRVQAIDQNNNDGGWSPWWEFVIEFLG